MEFCGKVLRKVVAAGSKSERAAVVPKTDDNAYLLRVLGGNPFHDDRLEALVGKRIHADGELHSGTLLMRSWSEG